MACHLCLRQAPIWTNARILSTRPLGTNISEILIEIQTFSFKKMPLKTSSAKVAAILSRPQCVNIWWYLDALTHWGRVTHICVGKLSIIGSDNGLSPGRRQAIIWTNDGILLIGPLGTNFNEIVIGIQTFSVKKMHLKMSSGKWRPLCLGLMNEAITGLWLIICSMTRPLPKPMLTYQLDL